MAKRKLGTRFERAFLKVGRKIAPKDSIVISKAPRGLLSKSEAKEILKVLGDARGKGKIPPLTYIYNPEPFPWAKDIITLWPKNGTLSANASKVRMVLKNVFGTKYKAVIG